MFSPTDDQLYSTECQLLALVAGSYLLAVVVTLLRRSRPGLSIGLPIAAAFIVRVLAAFGLELTPVARELRGGDEVTFLDRAQDLASVPLASEPSVDALTNQLHTFLF